MTIFHDSKRAVLILIAFFCGGAVPIQVVTLSFGYAQYLKGILKGPEAIMTAHSFAAPYILFVYIPAMVVLAGIVLYSRKNYPDVFRRIVFGLCAGLIGTAALDAFRYMGVVHGWLPGDTIQMFGMMATGSKSLWAWFPAGVFVHYMDGASFGLILAFVMGKQNSYARAIRWGTAWLLVMELLMMVGPPMAAMVGPFGVDFHWPGLFLITLIAHISSGAAMGFFVEFFLKEEDAGWLLLWLRRPSRSEPTRRRSAE